jgi:hypothetical protein
VAGGRLAALSVAVIVAVPATSPTVYVAPAELQRGQVVVLDSVGDVVGILAVVGGVVGAASGDLHGATLGPHHQCVIFGVTVTV